MAAWVYLKDPSLKLDWDQLASMLRAIIPIPLSLHGLLWPYEENWLYENIDGIA